MLTLIKNGTLITAADTIQADLLIDGEKIEIIGQNLNTEGAAVIDASGKYILPGGIDVHTHLELPVGVTISSDDFYTGHKAAAFGGTTTHIDFAIPERGRSLRSGIETWHAKAAGKAVIDYAFHANLVEVNDDIVAEIPSLIEEAILSAPSIPATASSTLLVTCPSSSLGAAPNCVIATEMTGTSMFGERVIGNLVKLK